MGPGVRTAKVRVLLGIDGLEKRIWGSRDNSRVDTLSHNKLSDSTDDADIEGDESEGTDGAEEPENSEEETDDEDGVGRTSDKSDSETSWHAHVSRADEQKFLQKAERLLSRVLANADANGKGMSCEMGEHRNPPLNRSVLNRVSV